MTRRDYRLMILGGGHTVLPLIEAARSMKLHVVVVSPTGPYVGLPLADTHVACDVTDSNAVLAAARQLAIDGIATTGTDIAVPTIGRIVDALALPGTGFDAATCCSDKWLMKQRLASEGVPVAAGRLTTRDEAKALACELGFPVFIKAVDSSGSRGVTRVNDESEVDAAWIEAQHASLSGRVIVEQCVDGLEFGAQVVVEGERATSVFLHNDQLSPPPIFAPIGHSMPCTLPPRLATVASRVCRDAVEALGIRNSIANVDLMAVDDRVYVLEVGARMGATCLPETISIYGGFDAYSVAIRLALGMPAGIPPEPTGRPNASRLICSDRSGILKAITVPDRIRNNPQVHGIRFYKTVGDQVTAFRSGPDRVGDLIALGDSTEQAEHLAVTAASEIHLEVQ
jgi:biotin carboxylase